MKQINHYGTVIKVKTGLVQVKITRYSACHNCDARHGCGLMDCQNKIVDIATPHARDYQSGEEVIVGMAQTFALKAVFLAYLLPLILMVAALVIADICKCSEIISGISAIIILIPYYFWLFLSKKRLAGKFRFTISKITD